MREAVYEVKSLGWVSLRQVLQVKTWLGLQSSLCKNWSGGYSEIRISGQLLVLSISHLFLPGLWSFVSRDKPTNQRTISFYLILVFLITGTGVCDSFSSQTS